MDIHRNGSRASSKGLAEYFTGAVRIDPLLATAAPALCAGTSGRDD